MKPDEALALWDMRQRALGRDPELIGEHEYAKVRCPCCQTQIPWRVVLGLPEDVIEAPTRKPRRRKRPKRRFYPKTRPFPGAIIGIKGTVLKPSNRKRS